MIKLRVIFKISLFSLIGMMSVHSHSFTRDDVADKTKPIWTDFTANLHHQFVSQTPFRGLNVVLCTVNNSAYQDFTNFKADDGDVSQAYKANLNDNDCSTNEGDDAYIFRSTQDNSEAALVIESWIINNGMDRSRLILEEEASDSNPFGVMSVIRNIFDSDGVSLYRLTAKSERLASSSVQYKMTTWVDSHLISQSRAIGYSSEFYASNIIYEEGDAGYGTVSGFTFNEAAAMPFPQGTPATINTTNLSFNSDFFLYQESIRRSGVTNWDSPEVCLDRDSSWRYVPSFGYGIYDSNGDRFQGGQVTYSNEGVLESFAAGGTNAQIPTVCRAIEDGTLAANCGYEFAPDGTPVGIALTGAELIPAFDIPDGGLVTGSDGTEYLVRQLKPRTVYAQVAIENCTGLFLQETLATPDHRFSESIEGEVPPSGALLVNAYELGDSIGDPNFSGAIYSADVDLDNDNVPNYLDAFPEDTNKSTDADYDGVEDGDDETVSQTIFQLPDYSELEMQDYPEKGTLEN